LKFQKNNFADYVSRFSGKIYRSVGTAASYPSLVYVRSFFLGFLTQVIEVFTQFMPKGVIRLKTGNRKPTGAKIIGQAPMSSSNSRMLIPSGWGKG
jgi:hypothetical protein